MSQVVLWGRSPLPQKERERAGDSRNYGKKGKDGVGYKERTNWEVRQRI